MLEGLSNGKYTKKEVSQIYEVDMGTITDWIHTYKREDLLNTRLNEETTDELSRIHEPEKQWPYSRS